MCSLVLFVTPLSRLCYLSLVFSRQDSDAEECSSFHHGRNPSENKQLLLKQERIWHSQEERSFGTSLLVVSTMFWLKVTSHCCRWHIIFFLSHIRLLFSLFSGMTRLLTKPERITLCINSSSSKHLYYTVKTIMMSSYNIYCQYRKLLVSLKCKYTFN